MFWWVRGHRREGARTVQSTPRADTHPLLGAGMDGCLWCWLSSKTFGGGKKKKNVPSGTTKSVTQRGRCACFLYQWTPFLLACVGSSWILYIISLKCNCEPTSPPSLTQVHNNKLLSYFFFFAFKSNKHHSVWKYYSCYSDFPSVSIFPKNIYPTFVFLFFPTTVTLWAPWTHVKYFWIVQWNDVNIMSCWSFNQLCSLAGTLGTWSTRAMGNSTSWFCAGERATAGESLQHAN